MKRKIEDFDSFSFRCPYFYNDETSNVGNGYNCKHKDCGDVEEGIGRCFTFSCPLVPTAEEEDFNDQNIDLNGFDKDDYYEDTFVLVELNE